MTARIEPPSAEALTELARTMTRPQMAAHYGVHIITIRRWLRAYKMTEDRSNKPVYVSPHKLRAAVDQGLSQKQIAKRLGVCIDVIVKALKRQGLRTARQAYLDGVEQRRRQAVEDVRPSASAFAAANPFGLAHASYFSPASSGQSSG